MLRREAGFTLIEVILVAAIAAALGAVIFIGQRQIREQAQFTDAIENVTTLVNRTKNEAATNVNIAGSGTNQSSVIMGKKLTFIDNSSQILVYDMTLNGPTVNYSSPQTQTIPWGVQFKGSPAGNYSLYFVRDSVTGSLYTYTPTVPPPDTVGDWFKPGSLASRGLVSYAFQDLSGRRATITVDGASGSISRTYQ